MTDPSVEAIVSGRCLVARVSGEMDYATEPVFRPQFKELLDAGGAVLVLACVPESLRPILQLTGIDRLLRVYDTVTDAEATFGG